MSLAVNVRINARELFSLVGTIDDRTESARRSFMTEGSKLVEVQMRVLAPYSKGDLVRSVQTFFTIDGFTVRPTVPYYMYPERGTGIFGPRGRRIFPVKAKALRWESGGKVFFAASIKGQPGQFYIKRTHEMVQPDLFRLADDIWFTTWAGETWRGL